ncbi:MAG: tetratricopeptide repeat protein [Promethearchaeota archaeon]
MANQTRDKIAQAQNLKEQCKFKKVLEILSNIENVNELSVNEQISFYLLQSFCFFCLDQYNKALDAADWVFQKGKKTGNELVMLDASLARGRALLRLLKSKEIYKSILKCEELIYRIKDQPKEIIGKRKIVLSFIKGWYYSQIGKIDKFLEQAKLNLDLSEKYGTKLDIAAAFYMIGASYNETGDFTKAIENLENSLKLYKELDCKMRIAWVSIQKGWCYRRIGKIEKYFEYSKIFLALSEKYGTKEDMVIAFKSIAGFYIETGDFPKALENYEKSLKISKEFKLKYFISSIYMSMGWIYHNIGDLDRGLEYYEQSLSIFEEIGNKLGMASNLENIGLILYEKGDLDQALYYSKLSLQLAKEIGNNYEISGSLFYIIPIYLDQNDLESAQICLEELKKIDEMKENRRVNQSFRITKALILKKIGGNRNIIKAEDILNELLEEKSVDNELLVIILLNLCDLLYKELQISKESAILEEIPPLITRLLEISEKMHSFLLLAEINIFKAKLELINLDLDEAQRLLTKAQQIAQKFALSRLEKKISLEHDQLLEKLDIWEELKDRNAPISERLKIVSFEGDLNLMMKKKEIEQVEILPEEPLLLSIISKGGISLFTHFFSKEWENKLLFSSFMDAFNSFSHEFFSKTLDRVKIGDNTIIMATFEDKILCYVIKGQTYPAQQKLNKFSEGIKNSKEILDAINRSFSTGAILNEENTPVLGELVNAIFV